MNPEEGSWIEEARGGSQEGFEKLVEHYQKRLFGFIFSYVGRQDVADDLTQETFLKAWRGLSSFRSESSFQTWLFQIAMNNTRSWGRKEKVRNLRERAMSLFRDKEDKDILLDQVADQAPQGDPERQAEGLEVRRWYQKAVATLPPKEKAVFLLRHEQDMPLKDIAQTLGIAEGTVKAHLFHALAKLSKDREAES